MERDVEEEEDDIGCQHDLEEVDLTVQHLPQPKQLVRRRYQLKVGVQLDGLLTPTVNNYFKLVGGQRQKMSSAYGQPSL